MAADDEKAAGGKTAEDIVKGRLQDLPAIIREEIVS